MKCKKCKKGELLDLVNVGINDLHKFVVTGNVYICDNCEKLTLIKLKLLNRKEESK